MTPASLRKANTSDIFHQSDYTLRAAAPTSASALQTVRDEYEDPAAAASTPPRAESLSMASARFGLYLALRVGWYVKPVSGPPAKPLDRAPCEAGPPPAAG